jgi:hypothetical protein
MCEEESIYNEMPSVIHYSEEEKTAIRKKEERRLKKIFKEYSDEINSLAKPLINSCSFMYAEIKEAEMQIQKNGSVEVYMNGKNQWGKKKSASVEVHNILINNYTKVIKQLIDLLPKKSVNQALEDFSEFLGSNKN